ncbi:phospholipid/cholesterol/gamma-HCH transport system substrate-binding protein [Nocardioides sp. J9]|uniref:MlaD family protein n=1 Tax=unclassified Nocardioides TaxID=2615069 RepID=UPI00048AE60A|nr:MULTISPECIES: MlaD family protein [unclassified Nocardioides]TWH00873.1 phospholipid/cholesterol/gamma-HCH transport system substrate-binding protein [Nocardioides sp. J9]
MPRPLIAALGAGALLVATAGVVTAADDDYTLDVVLPAATNLVAGSEVEIDGATAGRVKELQTRDGKAVVTVALEDDHAPLHDGTTARVSYKALLGERILELFPGKDAAPELPDGALVEGSVDRVELDQVLAALDKPTRTRLKSLLDRLETTLDGKERDVRSTLESLGPAVEALGQVLEAVGKDGPAIRKLVTRLSTLMSTLDERDGELASTVSDLSRATGTIAANRSQLSKALADLPETLAVAKSTLDDVPATVDEATPLLEALAPGMEQLPGVAKQLEPVLRDLRPTIAQLRPTLASARSLLELTPALLDGADSVLPQANQVLADLGPAVTYLRPYTPELVGWLANWGSAAANYDSNGHYLRAFITEGTTSLNHNPGIVPPGITRKLTRLPGESEGQPWTDAHGSEMQ